MEMQLREADKTLRVNARVEIFSNCNRKFKLRRDLHTRDRGLIIKVKYRYGGILIYAIATQANHSKVFYVAILESLAILVVTVWQVYYIKRLLDNRRII